MTRVQALTAAQFDHIPAASCIPAAAALEPLEGPSGSQAHRAQRQACQAALAWAGQASCRLERRQAAATRHSQGLQQAGGGRRQLSEAAGSGGGGGVAAVQQARCGAIGRAHGWPNTPSSCRARTRRPRRARTGRRRPKAWARLLEAGCRLETGCHGSGACWQGGRAHVRALAADGRASHAPGPPPVPCPDPHLAAAGCRIEAAEDSRPAPQGVAGSPTLLQGSGRLDTDPGHRDGAIRATQGFVARVRMKARLDQNPSIPRLQHSLHACRCLTSARIACMAQTTAVAATATALALALVILALPQAWRGGRHSTDTSPNSMGAGSSKAAAAGTQAAPAAEATAADGGSAGAEKVGAGLLLT